MRIIADLHIHSKYARATSPQLTFPNIDQWARIKGINLIGTGDFTHPMWLSEMKKYLELSKNGFYTLKKEHSVADLMFPDEKVYFVPTAEIASIFTQGGKGRRIHTVVIAPSFETVSEINQKLISLGANLSSDGRPIVGISAKAIAKIVLDIEPKCLIIPAHIWTPWFAIFGSKSGFDSVEECYEELSPYIYALETGLSSDPEMNWRLSALDKYLLVSNSDAHSLSKLGREANVLEISEKEFSYDEFYRIIKEKDRARFKMTIEYYPEEGMYHFDGHRACNYRVSPEEAEKSNCICPVCGRKITVGVLHRVNDLANRAEGVMPDAAIPFKKLVPLEEIISQVFSVGVHSKKVSQNYLDLIRQFGPEYLILLEADTKKVEASFPKIGQAIEKVRNGELTINPGYDGSYGEVTIFRGSGLTKPS